MTMLVLINTPNELILASDRRQVYMENEKVIEVQSDSINKIIEWDGGYFSGCGYLPLINLVKDYVRYNNIEDIFDIKYFINQKLEENHYHESWISKTHFIATYWSNVGGRAVIFDGNESENIIAIEEHSCRILAKGKSANKISNDITYILRNENYNFSDILNILKKSFDLISKEDETVSKDFDITIVNPEKRFLLKSEEI